jgi:hypothetical protein
LKSPESAELVLEPETAQLTVLTTPRLTECVKVKVVVPILPTRLLGVCATNLIGVVLEIFVAV